MRCIILDAELPADLAQLGASFTMNADGQTVAELPPDCALVVREMEDYRRANAMVQRPQTAPDDLPFLETANVATSAEVLAFAQALGYGVVRAANGDFRPVFTGHEPPLAVVVRFVAAPAATHLGKLTNPFPLFKKRQDGKVIVPLPGDLHIAERALSEDELKKLGVEFLRDRRGNYVEYVALTSGDRSVFIPSRTGVGLDTQLGTATAVVWQFKGVGCRRYVCDFADIVNGKVALRNSSDVIISGGDTAFLPPGLVACQHAAYAGQSGIFADVVHQPYSRTPTGGEGDPRRTVEMQKDLTAADGALGRTFLYAAELLTRRRMHGVFGAVSNNLTVEALYATCEAYTGSTLRLDAAIGPFWIRTESWAGARAIAAHELDELLVVEYGEASEASRDAKLAAFALQCGQNVRAALKARRTVYIDRHFSGNLTWDGLPVDLGDYHKAGWWGQYGGLVLWYLMALLHLAGAAGTTPLEFFARGFAKIFFSGFLPEEEAQSCAKVGLEDFRQFGPDGDWERLEDVAGVMAAKAATRWVLQRLSVRNVPGKVYVSPLEFFNACRRDPTLKGLVSGNARANMSAAGRLAKAGEEELVAGAAEQALPGVVEMLILSNGVEKNHPEKWISDRSLRSPTLDCYLSVSIQALSQITA